MKNKISQTILMLLAASIILLGSTNSGTNKLLQKARALSQKAFLSYNMQMFQQSAALCERVLSAEPDNAKARYYLAYNQYRILIILTNSKSKSSSKDYSISAIKNLGKISEVKNYKSESRALLAAVYMMKLAEDQSEAPAISQKIYALLAQAKDYDNRNPRIYLIKGIMLFNTPKMFGGSSKKAIQNFDKAISLFGKQRKNPVSWGYLETLAWKGQALARLGKYDDAKAVYNKALKTEPNFGWVKFNLLPALLKLESISKIETNRDSTSYAQIDVLITGLDNNKGKVRVGIYDSEDSYKSSKAFKTARVSVKNKTAKYVFVNIPFGTYAIKFYHDANGNGKLDKNFFGMPTEDYGFSNNATGNFGPASFDDAKFTVDKKSVPMKMSVQ